MPILLSNGHSFEHMVASGALAYDGKGWPWEWPLRWFGAIEPRLFTVVTKTLTFDPQKGNPLHKWVRFIPDGTVNAVGLANPGIDWWCERIGPKVSPSNIPIVVSILDSDNVKLTEMVCKLNPFDIVGIEISVSCPNDLDTKNVRVEHIVDACRLAFHATHHPIILKLSVTHADDLEQILSRVKEYVQAISINSVPWSLVYPDQQSPLASLGGGGVSGKAAQSFTWALAKDLVRLGTIPVIGPSVWEYGDIAKLRENIGVQAISFGSIFLRHPIRPTAFVRADLREYGNSR